jgi:hypothetical protein
MKRIFEKSDQQVDCSKHNGSQKIQFSITRMLVVGTGKAGGLGEAGGPTRQVDQQGRWANKAGGPTRQVGQQGRWANKAGGPTRQVGQQGRWANKAGG